MIEEYYAVDLDVIDEETNDVLYRSRFVRHFDTEKEAIAFIDGRNSAKNTEECHKYFVRYVREDNEAKERHEKIVYSCSAWVYRRNDGSVMHSFHSPS